MQIITNEFAAAVEAEITKQLAATGKATRASVCEALGCVGYEGCVSVLLEQDQLPFRAVKRQGIVAGDYQTGKEQAEAKRAAKAAAKAQAEAEKAQKAKEKAEAKAAEAKAAAEAAAAKAAQVRREAEAATTETPTVVEEEETSEETTTDLVVAQTQTLVGPVQETTA